MPSSSSEARALCGAAYELYCRGAGPARRRAEDDRQRHRRSTEVSFGFHTAVQIATDAIDRLHTTAEAHDRVMVCEVMGRNAGWIAIYAGIAGGAAEIIIPEEPFDIDAICANLRQAASARGAGLRSSSSPKERSRSPGRSWSRARGRHVRPPSASAASPTSSRSEIEHRTGFESRVTILGHVQRGGTPTAFDRVLATRFGMAAIDAVHDGAFGQMVALQGDRIVLVPLVGRGRAGTGRRPFPTSLFEVAEVFCRWRLDC